jgi:hypothetical protein
VGGQLFRFGQHSIMTAPSITNPHFLLLGPFMPISADIDMIDRYLLDVSNVKSVLVSHAHYNYLMDVPYVMQTKAKKAHIYGSKTMAHRFVRSVSSHDFFKRFENALPKNSSWTIPLLYNTQYFAPHGKILTLDQAHQ